MSRLFLDCEWADETGKQLVSLALVSEDGQHRFYSEVDPLPKQPTDWVRAVVYPLLEHGYAARQKVEFTCDLRAFLARFEAVHHHLPPMETLGRGKELGSRWAEIAWYIQHARPDIGEQ